MSMVHNIFMKSQIYGSKDAINQTLGSSLRILSTLQLARFSAVNIRNLLSGEGGLGDALSLATNVVILTARVNDLLSAALAKQTAITALRALVDPAALVGLAAGGIAVAGAGGIAAWQNETMGNVARAPAYRELAYRSVMN